MRFLVRSKMGKGCDYTIGCGISTNEIEAASMDEACAKALSAVSCDGDHWKERGNIRGDLAGDHALESLTVFAISEQRSVDLSAARATAKAAKEAAIKTSREAAEKAEFERLSKKWGTK